jgi:predicted NBD/HSP70 family sugar kinase
MKIIADIGGTKTRMAGSNDLMGFSEPVIFDTPKLYDDAVKKIVTTAREIGSGEHIDGVQIGIRGNVLKERGVIIDMVLSDWSERLLAHDIATSLSAHVEMENDVSTAALGEAHFGAGVGTSIVVYITVSTGVNGSRIVDGRIDRARSGFEIGGQYLNIEPTITFEDMVSGSAVQRQFKMHPRELGKDNPLWDELAQLCAFGVHNTILHWSPERVILGGSMFNEIGISVPKVAENVGKIMQKHPEIPEIVHSSLGDLGGLWGALVLLRQRS